MKSYEIVEKELSFRPSDLLSHSSPDLVSYVVHQTLDTSNQIRCHYIDNIGDLQIRINRLHRFIFFGASVLGLLVALPCSFHFFIINSTGLTGMLNYSESFLYPFQLHTLELCCFWHQESVLLPLAFRRCWQIFTWWSLVLEWPIVTPILACNLACLFVNVQERCRSTRITL